MASWKIRVMRDARQPTKCEAAVHDRVAFKNSTNGDHDAKRHVDACWLWILQLPLVPLLPGKCWPLWKGLTSPAVYQLHATSASLFGIAHYIQNTYGVIICPLWWVKSHFWWKGPLVSGQSHYHSFVQTQKIHTWCLLDSCGYSSSCN